MKTIPNSFRALCAVLIAGALFAACTDSDDENIPVTKIYKLSIKAGKTTDATRALILNETADGKKLDFAWQQGDRVLVYKFSFPGEEAPVGTMPTQTFIGTLTATDISDDGQLCTLAGNISSPLQKGDMLQFFAPGLPYSYLGQKGTLEDIAKNYDYAMATADVQDVDTETGQIMLDEDYLPFQASQAVVRLTLFSGNTPLIANSVTISGINGYTFMQASTGMIGSAASFGEITITPEEPTNEIWAALAMLSSGLQGYGARRLVPPGLGGISVAATVGNDTYIYQRDDVYIYTGEFYDVQLDMSMIY